MDINMTETDVKIRCFVFKYKHNMKLNVCKQNKKTFKYKTVWNKFSLN
jgi:hypothetical protein